MKKQIQECFLTLCMQWKHYVLERIIVWNIDTVSATICPRVTLLLNISKLSFKTGVNNKEQFIPMHKICSEIGHDMSLVLPVIHALTGCNSTSAFSKIGKKSVLDALEEMMKDQ